MSTPELDIPRHEWQSLLDDGGTDGAALYSCVVEGLSVAVVSRLGDKVAADLRMDDGSGLVETYGIGTREGEPTSVAEAMQLVEEALSLSAHR